MSRPSIIEKYFSKSMIKELYYLAWRSDIADLNDKASIVHRMLTPEGFDEVGNGTNRIALKKGGIIFKIAVDQPGLNDNLTELKRSGEKTYFPKVYECNYLIVAEEYWTVMDLDTFIQNERQIKIILKDLAKDYIFNDLGYQQKNLANWGYREIMTSDGQPDGELGILDFGYVYPKIGQDEALSCPICGAELKYDSLYVNLVCSSNTCRATYSPDDIINRMDMTLDNFETKMFMDILNIPEPIIRYNGQRKKEEK